MRSNFKLRIDLVLDVYSFVVNVVASFLSSYQTEHKIPWFSQTNVICSTHKEWDVEPEATEGLVNNAVPQLWVFVFISPYVRPCHHQSPPTPPGHSGTLHPSLLHLPADQTHPHMQYCSTVPDPRWRPTAHQSEQ